MLIKVKPWPDFESGAKDIEAFCWPDGLFSNHKSKVLLAQRASSAKKASSLRFIEQIIIYIISLHLLLFTGLHAFPIYRMHETCYTTAKWQSRPSVQGTHIWRLPCRCRH